MNQRLITVREQDNRSLEAVESMRQERTAEVAALRAEVARLRESLRIARQDVDLLERTRRWYQQRMEQCRR